MRRCRNGSAALRRGGAITLLLLTLLVILYNALFTFSYSVGPNYRNVSIDTRVNITNAAPEVIDVTMANPVTLNAGSTTNVQCNVSVRDFNGWATLNYTEAVLYHSSSSQDAVDDNNIHYTNTNCSRVAENGDYANYTCDFTVYYYALNGTWTCNATAWDLSDYNGTNSSTTTFNQVLALNVTNLIDYGDMAVGETSTNRTANVSNIGNTAINVSVKGYGATPGDGLSFVCDSGNIPVDAQRFSNNIADDYAAKTSLQSTFQDVAITIPKQTVPGTPPEDTTYWQLYVPPNPFGQCNGTVVFMAFAP